MDPATFVKEYSIKSLVCCFSAGKDSLVATHYILSTLQNVDDLDRYVVFVNTGVSIPGVVDYVREVADLYGWPLLILAPQVPFLERALKWGMPRMRHRWCCFHCKLQPIMEFVKGLRPQRAEVLGLRRAESRDRSKLPQILFKRRTWSWGYSPILDWSDGKVAAYIRRHKLRVNPNYRLISHSGECLCGVYSSLRELRVIRRRWPEYFYQFVELERRFRSGGAAFYLNNKPVRAEEIWNEKYGEIE